MIHIILRKSRSYDLVQSANTLYILNVGAVVGDHMCTHCSSFLSNDCYNSH
jgi:hypothetical protein